MLILEKFLDATVLVTLREEDYIRKRDLYQLYCEFRRSFWADVANAADTHYHQINRNMDLELTRHRFSRLLTAKGFRSKVKYFSDTGKPERAWIGVRIRS